ncbi:MAG: proton-conducting transporter membrane subunit [Bilophila sp.]
MGDVAPASAWELTVVAVGLLALLYGTFRAYQGRGRPGLLIVWGAVADLGLAFMGYGLGGGSGVAGATLVLLYHGVSRYAAWIALTGMVVAPWTAGVRALRGAVWRRPVPAVLFALTMVAALGTSPVQTPDGRHLLHHVMGVQGGPLLVVVVALAYTVLTWLTAEVVLAACFTSRAETLEQNACEEGALPPLAVPEGQPENTALRSWGDGLTPSALYAALRGSSSRLLYSLVLLLVLFGLFRELVQGCGAWISGVASGELPVMEGHWHLGALVLFAGAFPVLWTRLVPVARRTVYVLSVMLLAFVLTCLVDVTPLARLFGVIITGIGFLVACYSVDYIEEDNRKPWYWFLLLLTFGALLGIVSTTNLGAFGSFWEIMSWASFALVAWECTEKGRAAAIKYIVICGGAALVMLPGLFMLGGAMTDFGDVFNLGVGGRTPEALRFGLMFALIGFAAKAGLVPLHGWLPDAHPAAPSSVSAPLSGVLTKVGVFGIIVAYYLLVGRPEIRELGTIGGLSVPGMLVTLLGLVTMFFGECMALRQDDIKRMLAYSTMGQVGEICTVLGIGTWLATTGALTHVLNHAIMKDLLFLCAGGLIMRVGSRKLSDLAGLAQKMPWTVGCMSIGLVAVMGLPPFNGFISKYLMIAACMDASQPLLAAALLAASLIGAVYYMRILRTLLLDEAPVSRPWIREIPLSMRVPLVILTGLCVLFGMAPQTGLSLVTPVAGMLTGMGTGQGAIAQGILSSLSVSWPVFVVLPMVGALIPVFFRRDPVRAGWGSAAILALTTLHVLCFGQSLDTLSFWMAVIVPFMGALNLVYSVSYMEHSHTQWRFYTFFLLMVGGLEGVAASSDLFSFFTFWEIMSSWTLYFAIVHEGTPEALREGFKYFLFNIAGAGFLFLGIGILVAHTGTSQFAEIGAALGTLSPAWGTAVLGLLALGFCMKAAQVSLRIDWQMHPVLAPTPVSGYISSVLLKIAVFGLVKLFLVFGGGLVQHAANLGSLHGLVGADPFHLGTIMYLVAWVGAFTLLYSAFQAMVQTRLKLVFIWSTVSQIGYMVLGVAIGTSLGMAGGLLHMVSHVFFKDLLFLMVGAIMFRTHVDTITELGGVGRRMPVTMFCFFIAALTAVGVPPTSGFTSKWLIYQALMQQGEPLLALVSLVGSVVTLAYLARFMHTVFLGQPVRDLETIEDAPKVMRVPMLLLVFVVIVTGLFPGILLAPINEALVEYGMPGLDVAAWGIATGAGAWDATLVALLLLVSFGGVWIGLRIMLARVPVRVTDPHACGHDPALETSRIPSRNTYPALSQLLWRRGRRQA